MESHKKVVFIVGATATGKNKLALELCQKTGGCLINADSVQFYKDLIVGSASPSEDEKKLVPHYLYNTVDYPLEMTAGEFVRQFYKTVENHSFHYWPVYVVGGTGFYIQALEKGMFNVPEIDHSLKELIEHEIKTEGTEKAYKELISFDPDTKIHVNDAYRIGRALEVKRQFGLKMSELADKFKDQNKNALKFSSMKLGTTISDKVKHKEIISKRTQVMLSDGLIEETQQQLKAGRSLWAPLGSVGYKETVNYIESGCNDESLLIDQINLSTVQLVKKQKTWFKRDVDIDWVEEAKLTEAGLDKVKLFLNK